MKCRFWSDPIGGVLALYLLGVIAYVLVFVAYGCASPASEPVSPAVVQAELTRSVCDKFKECFPVEYAKAFTRLSECEDAAAKGIHGEPIGCSEGELSVCVDDVDAMVCPSSPKEMVTPVSCKKC